MTAILTALQAIRHWQAAPARRLSPHYERMQAALARLRNAELQIAQATTIEDLDIGRTALAQATAEVQHVIRMAKRERGIPLRSTEETEAIHRALLDRVAGRRNRVAKARRSG